MIKRISYRGRRDIGAVFTDSFAYIRLNYKWLFLNLLLFAGGFMLAGQLISGLVLGHGLGLTSAAVLMRGSIFVTSMLLVMFISLGVAGVVYMLVINKFILLSETSDVAAQPQPRQIAEGFFRDFWLLTGNIILFVIVMTLSAVLFYFVMIGVSEIVGTLVAALSLLVLFALSPVLLFMMVAAFFVIQRDRLNLFSALAVVSRYLKGNFWNTWVLGFLAILTYSLMSFVVQLPAFVLKMKVIFKRGAEGFQAEMTATELAVTVIGALLTMLVAALFYLLCIFHFSSLEEKKEGHLLREKISQIL